jgi:hypothetical protein
MQLSVSKTLKIFTLAVLLVPALAHDAWAGTNEVPDDVELAVLKKLYDSLGGSGWTNMACSWQLACYSYRRADGRLGGNHDHEW